ncbi:MAG TPA: CCA tRNA nucleotidyltransferase [Pirellulaceae bacterium]|jgi:tRNA nucleotidyltransferase/poly(A) polymerase
MPAIDPKLAREFAVDVVRRLRESGYQALWAGGCVRDQLMAMLPKDYDVATDAVPERVREVFGKRRTLEIGAAFGVVTVLGPREAGQIDVATFRRDAGYSDGRHPDAVTFSDAEHDAQRRDFTINGLFFDPLAEQVIDYVGGRDDLQRRIVRAIGDPRARIAEDKLRMLRAVRFAARFDFAIDADTLAAVKEQAHELVIVSAERIATELRLILTHPNRARGAELLVETNLLEILLPEIGLVLQNSEQWPRTIAALAGLHQPTFPMALAALIREIESPADRKVLAQSVCQRWKLSNEETSGVEKLLTEETTIRNARSEYWPKLQRILTAPRVTELLGYCEAVVRAIDNDLSHIDFCREKLALPPADLNPVPLITGEDLKQLGIPQGPEYRRLLEAVRDAQLERKITTEEEALTYAQNLKSKIGNLKSEI